MHKTTEALQLIMSTWKATGPEAPSAVLYNVDPLCPQCFHNIYACQRLGNGSIPPGMEGCNQEGASLTEVPCCLQLN